MSFFAPDPAETAPPAGCQAPKPGEATNLDGCAKGGTFALRGVHVEFNNARLMPDAKVALNAVAHALNAQTDIETGVNGHTDEFGNDQYNQRLSEARADAVKLYLIERGVASGRMAAHGPGETQPISDNETDEGRELNRRVEIQVKTSSSNGRTSGSTLAAE